MSWRFGKNIVAAIALALVVLVTWLVVHTLRKPGSMSVIEAQSMDMSTMLPPQGAVPVELGRVERARIEGWVTYTGTAQAYDDEDVYPRISGRIVQMPVYPGDRVKRGQLLVVLDPSDSEYAAKAREGQAKAEASMHNVSIARREFQEKKEQAESAAHRVDETKANLAYWSVEIGREKFLLDRGAIAQQEYDNELAQFNEALEKVQQAEKDKLAAEAAAAGMQQHIHHQGEEARAATAGARLAAIQNSYTHIFASEDGVVTKRSISPGVVVTPGMMILKLAHIKRIRLQAEVASDDASRVHVGNNVYFKDSDSSDEEIRAHVTSIFPAADPSSRTLIVEALINNLVTHLPSAALRAGESRLASVSDYRYLPGQYVVMRISTGQKEGLTIPTRAVTWKEGKAHVWKATGGAASSGAQEYSCLMHTEVRSDKPGTCPKCGMNLEPIRRSGRMTAQLVEIKTGLSNSERTEVISGLNDGDEVVSAGFANLLPGMPIIGTTWTTTGPAKLPTAAEVAGGSRLDSSNRWSLDKTVGDLTMNISTSPTPPKGGNNALIVRLSRHGGAVISGAQITAKTSMPTMSMPGPELTARTTNPGVYELKANFMTGLWRADLTVSSSGQTQQLTIDLEVP